MQRYFVSRQIRNTADTAAGPQGARCPHSSKSVSRLSVFEGHYAASFAACPRPPSRCKTFTRALLHRRSPGWPQAHITSVFPSVASQCGLQYFESLLAIQLHDGFAHFLFAIVHPAGCLIRLVARFVRSGQTVAGLATTMPATIERMESLGGVTTSP